eukprot:Hpha_TRINITY_DN1667_c0_g1::TRINITY_DN1667_c0_g1_i1::g.48657::m.48657
MTTPAGARGEGRVVYVACPGGVVEEFQVWRGSVRKMDTLRAGSEVLALSARYGALCAAVPGAVVIWTSASPSALAAALGEVRRAEPAQGLSTDGVVEAAAGRELLLDVPGASADAAVFVGDALAARCEATGQGSCRLPASVVHRLGTSAPVYLAASGVLASSAGTTLGVRVGHRIMDSVTVTLPAALPATGDAAVGAVAATDSLEGRAVLLSRPDEGRVQVVSYNETAAAWRPTATLGYIPTGGGDDAHNWTAPLAATCLRDGVIGSAAGLGEVELSGAAGVTVSAWIRMRTADGAPQEGSVVDCANSTVILGFVWNATTKMGLGLSYTATGSRGQTWQVSAEPGEFPSDGGWHHVAVVHRVHPNRADLWVDGVEVAQADMPPVAPRAGSCWVGYGDATGSRLDAHFRGVHIWESALSPRALSAVRLGALAPGQAGALKVGDGCASASRAGFGEALAFMRRGIGFVGVPDDCGDEDPSRCGGVLGYVVQDAELPLAPVLRVRPPLKGKRRFGAAIAATPDPGSDGGFLVVAEDGSGESAFGTLHLYRVTSPNPTRDRSDIEAAEGGGLRVALEDSAELVNCSYHQSSSPISIAAASLGVSVVCPGLLESSRPSLLLFDIADEGHVRGARLLPRWQRTAPEAASLWTGDGDGPRGGGGKLGRSTAPEGRREVLGDAPILQVGVTEAFNGTAGEALVSFSGPAEVTVVGRITADLLTGLGGPLALFSSSVFASPVERAAAVDVTWSGSLPTPRPDLGASGAAEGGFCELRDGGRRIVCKLGHGDECHATDVRWQEGVPAAFALRFVTDPSDPDGRGELSIWSSARLPSAPAKVATCTNHPRWGSPGAPVPLRLGAGLTGTAGPLYAWRTGLTDGRVEALLQRFGAPAFVPPSPAPAWAGGSAFVRVYQTTDCTSDYLTVPLSHSEGRCVHCWDTCGKEFGDRSAFGAVRSLQVHGSDGDGAAAYRLAEEGVTYVGCYTDSAVSRDLPVYGGNKSYTVASCALRCEPYAYFGLQDGQCWCGDGYGSDPSVHQQLPDSECGGVCSRETSGASTLRCGSMMVNAIYSLDAGCTGRTSTAGTISSATFAKPSDGCVSVGSTGAHHLRLLPAHSPRPRGARGRFGAGGGLAMNGRVVVAGDASAGAVWVWSRKDGALIQTLAPPQTVTESAFGSGLSLHRDTLVAPAAFVTRQKPPSEVVKVSPFGRGREVPLPYHVEMPDGRCTAGFRVLETAGECWKAASALALPTWSGYESLGAAEGTYGAGYPQGCYFRVSTQRLHFNRVGDLHSDDSDRRAICVRRQATSADVAQKGGRFFASGGAFVYKMGAEGSFGLVATLSDATAHNTTRRWVGAVATSRGVLASVSVGGRTALLHYPQDCGCSGRGWCETDPATRATRCRCATEGLDSTPGINCGACVAGRSWNGTHCTDAPCSGDPPCSGHGVCTRNSACACNAGWTGTQCSEPLSCEELAGKSKVRFECP